MILAWKIFLLNLSKTKTVFKNRVPLSSHRVSIERKSPYKEYYTVNSHWKMYGDMSQPKVA